MNERVLWKITADLKPRLRRAVIVAEGEGCITIQPDDDVERLMRSNFVGVYWHASLDAAISDATDEAVAEVCRAEKQLADARTRLAAVQALAGTEPKP